MKRLIDLGHGAGGTKMHALIRDVFGPAFAGRAGAGTDDAAVLDFGGKRLAFTTDGFVVRPLFFPGGDIGKLSVCGTVNDLCMVGAIPRWLSVSMVIEEGLEESILAQVSESIGRTAREAGVEVVTGDTKVVERGKADGLFITTSGIGEVPSGVRLSGSLAGPGMAVIVSGTVGDHEAAILNAREELVKTDELKSDCTPLHDLASLILKTCPSAACLRDPTRGGLATTLNEIAQQSRVTITIGETAVPIRRAVAGLCELLGLDPFYLACEGKLIAIVPEKDSSALLEKMRNHPLGTGAAVIGRVDAGPARVIVETSLGGLRVLDMLSGRPLPRIC